MAGKISTPLETTNMVMDAEYTVATYGSELEVSAGPLILNETPEILAEFSEGEVHASSDTFSEIGKNFEDNTQANWKEPSIISKELGELSKVMLTRWVRANEHLPSLDK